jgi:Fe2+ transport system protein FeoA
MRTPTRRVPGFGEEVQVKAVTLGGCTNVLCNHRIGRFLLVLGCRPGRRLEVVREPLLASREQWDRDFNFG